MTISGQSQLTADPASAPMLSTEGPRGLNSGLWSHLLLGPIVAPVLPGRRRLPFAQIYATGGGGVGRGKLWLMGWGQE